MRFSPTATCNIGSNMDLASSFDRYGDFPRSIDISSVRRLGERRCVVNGHLPGCRLIGTIRNDLDKVRNIPILKNSTVIFYRGNVDRKKMRFPVS